MVYATLAASFGWLATTCLLLWLSQRERAAHRQEIAHAMSALLGQVQSHQDRLTTLMQSHREEIAALSQARVEEVANLLQRIQAPQAATAEHAGRNAGPDPAPLDLDDDYELLREQERRIEQQFPGVLHPDLAGIAEAQ